MSTPEALYRNAIDLNRYSNSVARRVVVNYNNIILDAVDQLQRLIPNVTDGELPTITESQRAARLRSILAQLKDCLLYTSPSPRDRVLSRMPSSA